MRKGILVEEGSPQYILTKYNTNSLEESFLRACCEQETNQVNEYYYIKYYCLEQLLIPLIMYIPIYNQCLYVIITIYF